MPYPRLFSYCYSKSPKRCAITAFLAVTVLLSSVAKAAIPTTFEELNLMNRHKEDINYDLVAIDGFSEQIDAYMGGLSIGHKDLVFPGNGLDIEISRYYSQPTRSFAASGSGSPNIGSSPMGFGWDIHFGFVAPNGGWSQKAIASQARPTPTGEALVTQCWGPDITTYNLPRIAVNTQDGRQEEFYPSLTGDHMVTKSGWRGGCADTGFILYSPQGVKYTFDQLKYGAANWESNSWRYYVSRMEDKHGNWLVVNYSDSEQALVSSIEASDGRRVEFSYQIIDTLPTLMQISGETRTLNFAYDPKRRLREVSLGGQVIWQYQYTELPASLPLHDIAILNRIETETGGVYSYQYYPGVAEYIGEAEPPKVSQKSISGNLPPDTIQYSYETGISELVNHYTPEPAIETHGLGDIVKRRKTTVVDSDKCVVQLFHAEAAGNWIAGSLARKTTYSDPDCNPESELEQEEYHYDFVKMSAQKKRREFFALQVGLDGWVTDSAIWKAVLRDKTVTRNGDTFKVSYQSFSPFGAPEHITEYASTGGTRSIENAFVQPGLGFAIDIPTQQLLKDSGGTIYSQLAYQHDANFNVVKITQNGVSNRYEYHPDGNLKRIWFDGSERYDLLEDYYRGKARKVTQPCPQANDCGNENGSQSNTVVFLREVYADGKTQSITDFRGNKTSYYYNGLGRLTEIDIADPYWQDTQISYSQVSQYQDNIPGSGVLVGSLKQQVTRGNAKTTLYHDGLVRPIMVVEQDLTSANTKRYRYMSYDKNGQQRFAGQTSATAASRVGIYTDYDDLERVERRVRSTDNAVLAQYQYLPGYKMQVADANNNLTTTTYLEYGTPSYDLPQLIQSPDSADTLIQYNVLDQVTEITQAGISEKRFYDNQTRLCKSVRPETGVMAYGYNLRNQVVWRAEGTSASPTLCDTTGLPESDKVYLSYNQLNLISGEDYPDDSPDRQYRYDADGNLTQLVAGDVVHTYTYNSQSLIASETVTVEGKRIAADNTASSLTYQYSNLGYLSQLTYPDGDSIDFNPNALGQPTQVVRNARSGRASYNYVTGVTYHATGQVHTFTYGNGLQHETQLNSNFLPQRIKDASANLTALDYSYQYDAKDNVTQLTDHLDNSFTLSSLVYDGADRLLATSGDPDGIGSSTITYDLLGNISRYQSKGRDLSYSYDSNNRLTAVSGIADKYQSIQYDSRGNTIHNGKDSFSFNRAGQLKHAKDGSNSYLYDGHNRRVKQNDGKGVSYSLYSQDGNLFYRETELGAVNYIYLGKKLIAKDGVIPTNSGKQHYRPYGESIEGPNEDVGYTGHKYDTDIALSYMQARYYDPVIGRFYSNDPIGYRGVHSFNRYAYVNNNPYKYVDPDGKDAIVTLYKGEGGNIFNHIGIGTTTGKNANQTFGKGPNAGEGIGLLGNVPGHVAIDKTTPLKTLTIETTSEQDAAINAFNEAAAADLDTEYNLTQCSCVDHVREGLEAGGIELPSKKAGNGQMGRNQNNKAANTNLPNKLFEALESLGTVTVHENTENQ